jgi:hypothetical protein
MIWQGHSFFFDSTCFHLDWWFHTCHLWFFGAHTWKGALVSKGRRPSRRMIFGTQSSYFFLPPSATHQTWQGSATPMCKTSPSCQNRSFPSSRKWQGPPRCPWGCQAHAWAPVWHVVQFPNWNEIQQVGRLAWLSLGWQQTKGGKMMTFHRWEGQNGVARGTEGEGKQWNVFPPILPSPHSRLGHKNTQKVTIFSMWLFI